MRLTIFLFFIALIHASAASFGQNISIKETNASLKTVLHEIEQKSGYVFLYDSKVVSDQKISVNLANASINEVLDECFKNLSIDYKIVGKNIILQQKQPQTKTSTAPTPPVDIIGRVTNAAGQPLNGASVIVKRTQSGVLTNANGIFKLSGMYPTDTLYVSYVGYARAIVRIGGETNFKIVLKEATNSLDQVVIQAYGKTSQRLATGDIGSVRAEEIARQPVMNVLDVLQGQVPGAIVTNTSGYASGQIKVEIRGRNTISPSFASDPLYIIDGVPLSIVDVSGNSNYNTGGPGFIQSGLDSYAGGQSPLFSLDPKNIESLQVLKDADATAIYGSRGANGVILITTKKGAAGKSSLELNVRQGETFITRTLAMANTQQYIAMRKEALANDGFPVDINNSPDLVLGDPNRYTNWQKYVEGHPGTNTAANLAFSGGNVTTTYRIAASYDYSRDMTALSGGNSRGSFLLNLNHKSPNQRLSLELSANYSYSLSNQIPIPTAPNQVPDAPPVYNKLGNINYSGWDTFFGQPTSNPFGSLLQPYSASTNFLNANFLISYEILKGLTFKTSFGYNDVLNTQNNLLPIASQDPIRGNLYAGNNIGGTQNDNIIVEPQLEYNIFWKTSKISVSTGGTGQKTTTSASLLQGSGITNDALIEQINAAPVKNFNYSSGEYRYAGIFARVSYNLADKYIANLNFRRDGSSNFGPGKQYGNFGSIGVAWIFNEEKWVKENLGFISFGKIRASYGITGSDQIGSYQYLTQWVFAPFPYNGTIPLNPIKHTDSLFHWQQNKKMEVGLELNFLKDWVGFSVSRYIDRTNDQLVPFPTPAFTGFTSVLTNTPATVQNSGWEITARSKIVDGKDFRLSANFNIGLNRNKLVSYPNISQSPFNGILFIGQPLNIRRVLHGTGVDPQTGLYTFEDRNKDGQITYDFSGTKSDDSYTIDLTPKYDGSVTLVCNYRRWELSGMFYFRKQLGTKAALALDIPGDATNQPLDVIQHHWQQPGQIAEYAKFTTNPTDNSWAYFRLSDDMYTDASFIRMQNLDISYSVLGQHWKIKGIREIKLQIRAQNIFVLTKYKGTDPEIQNFGQLPLPRTITTGLSINF